MELTEKKSEGLMREFELSFSPQNISQKRNERLQEIGSTTKLPGFRPGKIPLPVLQQRFGASVEKEVLDKIIQEGVQKIITDHKLRVALQPQVSLQGEYHPDQPLKCKVALETLPEIEKVDLSKLSIEKLKAKIDEDRIEDGINTLRTRHMTQKPVNDKTKTKEGHIVHISFFGTVDDKPIAGGASDGMDLELGSGAFIPGFEAQLIGLKKGDKKEFDIDFPEDYGASDLAGKKAHFAVEIKEIKEKILPELNADFFQKFDKSSMEEVRALISEQLTASYAKLSLLDAKRKILDSLAEAYNFDVPKGLVDLELNSIVDQIKREMKEENGKEDFSSEEQEAFKTQYYDIAVRRVRLGLLLAEVGREHDVNVSAKELEQAIIQEALKYKGMERKVIDYYYNNPQAQASIRAPLFEDKVIELILNKAKTSEKEVSYADLLKRIEEITQDKEEA